MSRSPFLTPRLIKLLGWIRHRVRSSEFWLIALAIGAGAGAGLLAVLQSQIAHIVQTTLYGIDVDQRLSASQRLSPLQLIWLPVGGLAVGLLTALVRRRRPRVLVDVVEANALYGGRLSLADSVIVCAQTLLSNGVGASVGLEAAYAQAGGAVASTLGQRLRLRRNDLRTLVGAGAGAAIGAAFGAPLTGAFYAFEIVIGTYTPSAIAPVAAAALASVLVAKAMGGVPYSIHVASQASPDVYGYLLYSALGLICAIVGIAMMRLVAIAETAVRSSGIPVMARPALGGIILVGLAMASPQVLSAGHGALHLDLAVQASLGLLAGIFLLKSAASIVSLGFGFRGGLFFASLFLGTLLGQIYARALGLTGLSVELAPENAALVGMGALAVAIVGGPLTMSFLVLESTRDFGLAAATLAAALVASSVVRERFGYSFSTWRLHLRGETIRSARDVGWVRSLTAGRMMRKDIATIPVGATIAEFRRRIPLGSTSRAILVDDTGRYAGLVITASAYADNAKPEVDLAEFAISRNATLQPEMNIEDIMRAFDRTETEELVVVDGDGKVLGLLAQPYVSRRYARELEKVHMDLFGET
jgi:CIC family chloride channel protein